MAQSRKPQPTQRPVPTNVEVLRFEGGKQFSPFLITNQEYLSMADSGLRMDIDCDYPLYNGKDRTLFLIEKKASLFLKKLQ